MFDKNGYAEEAKRHNLAMEALTAEREKYLEQVTDRRNKVAQLKEELAEANSDIKSTNQSLELVRRINELTSAWRTVCMGRFLLSLDGSPKDVSTTTNGWSARVVT